MRSPSNQFITERTADGSPTLRGLELFAGSTMPESMHHSGGAASESEYIYGWVIRQALAVRQEIDFLVVGLGLGYIEILISSLVTDRQINSYEIDSQLREHFLNWTKGSKDFPIYDEVCISLKLEPELTLQNLKSNHLNLFAELNMQTTFKNKSHVICFDAFSQKTSGSLWTEEFIDYFLQNACAPDCVLTTYACTGLLKRTLEKHGFKVIKRPGFTGKRDSTWAVRGIFISETK